MRPTTMPPSVAASTSLILLFLLMFFSCLPPAIAEQATLDVLHEQASHGDEHAGHRHHHVVPGTRRSQVSYTMPPVSLIDQNGQHISLAELLDSDRPVMLNFIYTSCTAICPAMSATFASVQEQLGDDAGKVRMVSVSIDPEYDTPAALSDYARRFQAGPQWTFLTGSLDDVVAVQQAFDADRGDKMNHAPLTLLRGSPGGPWTRYDGFANSEELAEECRRLLSGNIPETRS